MISVIALWYDKFIGGLDTTTKYKYTAENRDMMAPSAYPDFSRKPFLSLFLFLLVLVLLF
jgi:hypothetical protein